LFAQTFLQSLQRFAFLSNQLIGIQELCTAAAPNAISPTCCVWLSSKATQLLQLVLLLGNHVVGNLDSALDREFVAFPAGRSRRNAVQTTGAERRRGVDRSLARPNSFSAPPY